MARQDRLMRLMAALRRLPSPVTAACLADETEISLRQLYRDIATLRSGGALIDGAVGFGYTLTEDAVLPPQSFSRIEALVLGIGSLETLGDPVLAKAGRDAVARLVATLPDGQARQAMHTILRSWRPPDQRPEVTLDMDLLRRACWDETSLWIVYRDMKDRCTEREIWPLGLSYSPGALMLLGYCQLRQDYRVFHVDRITELRAGANSFRPRRVDLLRAYATSRAVRGPPDIRAASRHSTKHCYCNCCFQCRGWDIAAIHRIKTGARKSFDIKQTALRPQHRSRSEPSLRSSTKPRAHLTSHPPRAARRTVAKAATGRPRRCNRGQARDTRRRTRPTC